jgi:hypothetical protein
MCPVLSFEFGPRKTIYLKMIKKLAIQEAMTEDRRPSLVVWCRINPRIPLPGIHSALIKRQRKKEKQV